MKIAVGIIALVASLVSLLQSCALSGVASAAKDEAVMQASALGVGTGLFMLFGAAFAFAVPRAAQACFVLGFLISVPARTDFPDAAVWGYACGLFAFLLMISSPKSKKGALASVKSLDARNERSEQARAQILASGDQELINRLLLMEATAGLGTATQSSRLPGKDSANGGPSVFGTAAAAAGGVLIADAIRDGDQAADTEGAEDESDFEL